MILNMKGLQKGRKVVNDGLLEGEHVGCGRMDPHVLATWVNKIDGY
jgi:hypothetical protein